MAFISLNVMNRLDSKCLQGKIISENADLKKLLADILGINMQ